jgi:hypothetical protein
VSRPVCRVFVAFCLVLSFRRNLYVAFCRVFVACFVIQKESLHHVFCRVVVAFCRVFCHSEGISTSRFCRVFVALSSRVLSFRRNLYVAFLLRFCCIVVVFCHSEGIFTSRFFYSLMLHTGAEHLNICRNCQTMFRKVQSTEISFAKCYGALHLESNAY